MTKCIISISEENHGIIGYVLTYPQAINFLIDKQWFEKHPTPDEEDELKDMWIEKFNSKFDGQFYLEVCELYYR